MGRSVVTTAILFLLLGTTQALASPPGYREGVQAFQDQDPLRAVGLFRHACAVDPGHVPSRFALAQAYHSVFREKNLFYEEALEAYRAVVNSLGPEVPGWSPLQFSRALLGLLLLRGGSYGDAIGSLESFLELQPEHRDADSLWNSIGVAHYYRNEYRKAVRAFERALRINPSLPSARFNQRSVFTRLARFDQAMANQRIGRLDLALADLDGLLLEAPRFLPAALQRAIVLRALNRSPEARKELERILTLSPPPEVEFEGRDLLGDLLAEGGHTDGALLQYRKCLRIFPGFLQTIEKIDALEDQDGGDPNPRPPVEPTTDTPTLQFPM